MRNADDQLNEYDNPFAHEGRPHAVAQGYDEIEKLNKAPFSDHDVGPGTKDFDED
jgi:hypothetical protein